MSQKNLNLRRVHVDKQSSEKVLSFENWTVLIISFVLCATLNTYSPKGHYWKKFYEPSADEEIKVQKVFNYRMSVTKRLRHIFSCQSLSENEKPWRTQSLFPPAMFQNFTRRGQNCMWQNFILLHKLCTREKNVTKKTSIFTNKFENDCSC
jgi:hypothetical protein